MKIRRITCKGARDNLPITGRTKFRWCALLECGHERWFTQTRRPRRTTIACPQGCAK